MVQFGLNIMNKEIEKGLSDDIEHFGNEFFGVISSRELTPVVKMDAFKKLLILLKGTASNKDDFLFISGLLHRSFFWGTIDGYIEGVREYEEINKINEELIEASNEKDFEIIAREVVEENKRRRILEIHGRQNKVYQ